MSPAFNPHQHPLKSGFGPTTTAADVLASCGDLSGKRVVLTGGYAGIGLETARRLSLAGAGLLVGARDLERAGAALEGLPQVTLAPLDLSQPASVDAFAAIYLKTQRPLDLLINNAGIMAIPETRDARGYEMQFATNHLGHFQLTARLWPALVANPQGARVITLTSAGHRFAAVDLQDPHFRAKPYDKWQAYGRSKTANSLFSVELDRLGQPHNVRAFAVHPGRIVTTDLVRHMTPAERNAMLKAAQEQQAGAGPNATKTVEQGAATTLWCAASPQLHGLGGLYCEDCDVSPGVADADPVPPGVKAWAVDPETARSLWTLSEGLLALNWPA